MYGREFALPFWKCLAELIHRLLTVALQMFVEPLTLLVAVIQPLHVEGRQPFARLAPSRDLTEILNRVFRAVRVRPIGLVDDQS